MKNKIKSSKVIIWFGAIFIVVWMVAGAYLLVNYVPSVKEAILFATTKKPESFTELYFVDHLSLPKQVKLFEKNNFGFTIHNLENNDIEYILEVYIDINGSKYRVDKNVVLIKNKEYKTIFQDFMIAVPSQQAKVVVNLINKNQEIYFLLEVKEKTE